MKFKINDRVRLMHTVNDGRTGKIVGTVITPIPMYGPMMSKSLCDEWAEKLSMDVQILLKQPLYIIELDKPMPPISYSELHEHYFEKFPNEESFNQWVDSKRKSVVATIEPDLELCDVIPDTIDELLGKE